MSLHKVIERRDLSDSAYILKFERENLKFIPGQHILVGLDDEDNRPYSIYSGAEDDFIEILVKAVSNGNISHKLRLIQPGEYVSVEPPHGSFTIDKEEKEAMVWLIGTGTGISPFHCFVRSYPALNYKIIHGIRYSHEAYEHEVYATEKYTCCTTREATGDFNGRVTEFLKNEPLNEKAFYYLCGNYEMIDEVFDLLTERGIDKMQIRTEGYF